MPAKSLIVCIFCSLITSKMALANEANLSRGNVKIIFEHSNAEEIDIAKLLDEQGIILDENSTIQIHNEENFIDLKCFNCIIRGVDSDTHVQGSKNEERS